MGIEVLRDWVAGTVTLFHKRTAFVLTETFGVAGQRWAVLMSQVSDKVEFWSWMGSLLHIAPCTRPDIGVSVSALAALRLSRQQRSLRRCLMSCPILAAQQLGVSLIATRPSQWSSGVMPTSRHAPTLGEAQLAGWPQFTVARPLGRAKNSRRQRAPSNKRVVLWQGRHCHCKKALSEFENVCSEFPGIAH